MTKKQTQYEALCSAIREYSNQFFLQGGNLIYVEPGFEEIFPWGRLNANLLLPGKTFPFYIYVDKTLKAHTPSKLEKLTQEQTISLLEQRGYYQEARALRKSKNMIRLNKTAQSAQKENLPIQENRLREGVRGASDKLLFLKQH